MKSTLPVELEGISGSRTRGEVEVQHFEASERMKRALKMLGMIWGGAVVAVFIPLLHFVLVPSLLIAGPIVAWVTYQSESMVLGGRAICPKCGADFPVAKTKEAWPLKDVCSKCFENVKIFRTGDQRG